MNAQSSAQDHARAYLRGKRVMVTGVCGTVGKQLARQLLENFEIASLTGIDNNESELAFLEERYGARYDAHFLLADIRDLAAITRETRNIEVLFHAAAYKHVFLCERSPFEAIQTNVIGVHNITRAAVENGVARLVFTSSDKAVNPTNVMGTSKLMGERLMTAAALDPNLSGATLNCPNLGPVAPPNTLTCSLNLPALSFTTAGFYSASITASDGSFSTNQTINITVGNVNRPPVIAAIVGTKFVGPGKTINVPLSATDPDPEDTNITFSVTNVTPAPVGVTLTPSGTNTSGNLQITVAANAPPQVLTITVTANDNDNVTPQAAGSGPLTASTQFTLSASSFLIVDDTTGMTLVFDAAGNYEVINCRKSKAPLIGGVGGVSVNGCKMFFAAGTGKGATQSVSATINTCTKVGSATIVFGGQTFSLRDANVGDDTICQ
jgi:NAD(P)-dependent dehydrogenase (short-subunit alcohol dehydrogenase family)